METISAAQLAYVLVTLVGVPLVGWLLSKKDEKQAQEIAILFRKHDDDAAALAALRVEIAKEHYLKHELDDRFRSLEQAIKESSATLGGKFDNLAETLVAHMIKEGKG